MRGKESTADTGHFWLVQIQKGIASNCEMDIIFLSTSSHRATSPPRYFSNVRHCHLTLA